MTETRTDNTRRALDDVRRIKAPTKRTAAIAGWITTLPTQAEVNDFTRQLRIDAGIQDVTLLPTDTTWTTRRRVDGVYREDGPYETDVLLNTLAEAEDVRIDWPSVTFHWGVAVTFVWGDETIIARSKDWRLTETYLSS